MCVWSQLPFWILFYMIIEKRNFYHQGKKGAGRARFSTGMGYSVCTCIEFKCVCWSQLPFWIVFIKFKIFYTKKTRRVPVTHFPRDETNKPTTSINVSAARLVRSCGLSHCTVWVVLVCSLNDVLTPTLSALQMRMLFVLTFFSE